MTKIATKKMVNYTIDREVFKELTEIARIKAVNRSALVELLLREWIKKNK